MHSKWLSLLKYEFISLLQTIKLVLNKCFLHKMTLFTSSIILSEIATLVDIYHLWSQKSTKDPCYSHQSLIFTMFCKMIAKDFKKLEGKWTYKVFMVGGGRFFMKHPVYIRKLLYAPIFNFMHPKINFMCLKIHFMHHKVTLCIQSLLYASKNLLYS